MPVRGTDSEHAARLKGDARMAEVLHRALWDRIGEPGRVDPGGPRLTAVAGARRSGSPSWSDELRERGVRYGTGREMLSHRIAHVILSQMEAAGETCDDRTHEAVRRTSQVRAAVTSIWPKADPVRVVFALLSDARGCSVAPPTACSARPSRPLILAAPAPRTGFRPLVGGGRGADRRGQGHDRADAEPRARRVDEAQDLSAMACRAIGRRCTTGSVTVLGDIAQGTTPWATPSWEQMLGHLGKSEATLEILTTGYRVPRQILDFASRLLAEIAPELAPAMSDQAGSRLARRHRGAGRRAWRGGVGGVRRGADQAGVDRGDQQRTRETRESPRRWAPPGLPHAILDGDAEGSQLWSFPSASPRAWSSTT